MSYFQDVNAIAKRLHEYGLNIWVNALRLNVGSPTQHQIEERLCDAALHTIFLCKSLIRAIERNRDTK